MKRIILLTGVAATLLAQNLKAAEVQPYVGADYVYSWADMDDGNYIKDRFHAFNISAGIMTSSVIGLELSYQQSLQNKKSSEIGQVKAEYKAYGLDGVYYASVLNNIQILADLGLGYYEIKAKLKSGNESAHAEDEHWGLRAGAGLQYNIDENLAARIMVKYHHIGSDAVNHMTDLSLGVRYYF